MPEVSPGRQPLLVITNWRDRCHPDAGGAEAVCEELAIRFGAVGYDVVLLSARVKDIPSKEQKEGYRVVRAGGRFTVYLRALSWILLHRKEISIVLDSQNGIPFFTPLVLPRSTTIVLLIYHIHQEQFGRYFPPWIAVIGRWLERVGCRLVYRQRAVIAISESTAIGARHTLRLRGTISVVHPGWHTSLEIGNQRCLRTDNPTVVAVGRLVPHKRNELLIESLASLKKYDETLHLHLIGSGPEGPFLKTLASRLDVSENVTFHHGTSNLERDKLISVAWLTVNTSQGEGWGLSVIEANSLGIPALAFDRPGLRDSIQAGQTGWLIEDDEELAIGIQMAIEQLRNPVYAEAISKRAITWAHQFSWEGMANDVLEVFDAEGKRLQPQSVRP